MREHVLTFVGFDSFTSKKGNLIKVVYGYYEEANGQYKTVQGFTENDFSDLSFLDEVNVVISWRNGSANVMRLKK